MLPGVTPETEAFFRVVTGDVPPIETILIEVPDAEGPYGAKGLGEQLVIGRHALRNALIPIITIIALNVPQLLGGTVIIEQVFAESSEIFLG